MVIFRENNRRVTSLGMMTAGPHPQSMPGSRPPFQGGPGVGVPGGAVGNAAGTVMGGAAVGGQGGANVVPMQTVSPSPSGNQMSNHQIIRSPANYNHLLPSPTGGSNYQNIPSPASNNFQGE